MNAWSLYQYNYHKIYNTFSLNKDYWTYFYQGTQGQYRSNPYPILNQIMSNVCQTIFSLIFQILLLQSMLQDFATRFTVFPLQDPDHISKLTKYLSDHQHNRKSSFCRFYLRGLCIMKPQYCKFAHDFDELDLSNEEYKKLSLLNCVLSDKQERKRQFLQKSDFYQRPLFFIKNLDYSGLYQYQFSERYQKATHPFLKVTQINKNESLRNRIREIMHREQWDKLINYLQANIPAVDYSISFFSSWFGKLGFEKSQTYCKFGDFMRYLIYVRGYVQVNIIMPPLVGRSIFYVKHKTLLFDNLEGAIDDSNMYRNHVRQIKQQRLKKLPENLHKRFICRFYMAGNCDKDSQECLYVHRIKELVYNKEIEFLPQFRQPPKSKQDRLNYISLYRYYMQHKKPQQQNISLEDINSKFGFKDKIRKAVHLELYSHFLQRLEEITGEDVLKLSFVKTEYVRFGFNHTDQNKFGQLEACFWDLGYYEEELEDVLSKKKIQYIYKIPPLQQMDQIYDEKIGNILKEQIGQKSIHQCTQILESSLRRLIYSNTSRQKFQIPLHVYLRKKALTLKQLIETRFGSYAKFIFFEGSEENFKKLIQLLKKYFKKHKQFAYEMAKIDSYIRQLNKEVINLNSFVNFRNLLELAVLELGKEIYCWPVANSCMIIDRCHSKEGQDGRQFQSTPITKESLSKYSQFIEQQLLVVDDEQSFQFCELILINCFVYGLDLEGKLCENGFIDLIQISCFNQQKYIFIIDVFTLLKHPVYKRLCMFLKSIFEDKQRLKIMHACQQDSIALHSCMDISLKCVFDTSATQIYVSQRQLYKELRQNKTTFQHLLFKIHTAKAPGLNQVLEKWKAPKGPNEYKESMKRIFTQANRSYFEARPIAKQFLHYSARDVQDLIEVWKAMSKQSENVWQLIGDIYKSY